MRVLIVGATGLIGNPLTNYLASHGCQVFATGRGPRPQHLSDKIFYAQYRLGTDIPEGVLDFQPAVLINLAWDGIPNFSMKTCLNNLKSHVLFIKQLEKIPSIKRIILSGSCAEYCSALGFMEEGIRNRPENYFAWSKLATYDAYQIYCDSSNINLINLRLFYVFGPRQRLQSLIPSILSGIESGLGHQVKNIYSCHDYIYLDDVVRAFFCAVKEDGVKGIFNIGSGYLISNSEIIDFISGCLPFKWDSHLKVEPIKLEGMYANNSRAKKILKWTPEINIRRGIQLTCDSFFKDRL
jgi:dTDP-6-deoxy-L-talose 4-dehydrogenase (NAD+)